MFFPLRYPAKTTGSRRLITQTWQKTPIFWLYRSHPGTPLLWPLLAEIARLDKTVFLVVSRTG
jgi:hypothetical protein